MNIYLSRKTAGRDGNSFRGNLQYFDTLIQNELGQSGFHSSFNEFTLTLCYPPLYVLPGVVGIETGFMKYYETLPNSRLNRRYKKVDVILKAPEFSEYFDIEEQLNYEHKFEIKNEYKNISETALAKIIIDKYFEAIDIIRPKIKKDDIFDFMTFEQALKRIKQKITPEFLTVTTRKFFARSEEDQVETAELKRAERLKSDLPKDTLIRDIRLYYSYQLPADLFYLNKFADIVLQRLIQKDFKCPRYHHLYISIGNTKEQALKRAIIAEDWYTFGIAVLKEETLLSTSQPEQQSLVLNAINVGLSDIALLDNLDKIKILEAIHEAEEIGVLSEVIFKAKENNKIIFVITTRPVPGKNEEEIYFTVIDKDTKRMAKWKFGQENICLIGGWFGTITVTNKVVRTKPRAYMDLVLAGKQKCLEIDVEKELNDPAKTVQNSSNVGV